MRSLFRALVAVAPFVSAFGGCSPSSSTSSTADSGPPGDAGAGAETGPTAVSITPHGGNALTCSKIRFSAGASNQGVTWTVDPATGAGSIDATGTYTGPPETPSPAKATVKAASSVDPSLNDAAQLTLATAFPGTPAAVTGSTYSGSYGVYPHWIAAKDKRVYAVWPTVNGADVQLMIARSDDAGVTWKPAVASIATTVKSVGTTIGCAAVAIDAANPDVVYTIARIGGGNALSTAVGADGQTLVLATSGDGAATFKPTVMQVGGTAGGPHGGWDSVGICGDVASPSPNTVVVESPGGYAGDGNPDIAFWSDGNRGAGFATGTADSDDYLANGYTDSLDNVTGAARMEIAQNGGSDDAGGATESPQLFTDGKGRLCITYLGTLSSQTNTFVQCSNDAGKTFSRPVAVDPATPADVGHSHAVGALDSNGRAAVVWNQGGLSGPNLFVATSTDAGATFSAPAPIPTYALKDTDGGSAPTMSSSIGYDAAGILWLTYRVYDGGFDDRVVVDKSCDGGKTWSGSVLVNGPEGSIKGMKLPSLAFIAGDAPRLMTAAGDHLATMSLAP